MPTTFTQRCARHAPFQRAISMTAGGACRLANARRVPVRVEDGDIITPRIACRVFRPVHCRCERPPRLLPSAHSIGRLVRSHRSGAMPNTVGRMRPLTIRRGRGVAQSPRREGARCHVGSGPGSPACGGRRSHWLGRSRCVHARRAWRGAVATAVWARQRCQPAALPTAPTGFCAPSPGGHSFFHLRWRNEQGATCAAPRCDGLAAVGPTATKPGEAAGVRRGCRASASAGTASRGTPPARAPSCPYGSRCVR